MHEFIIEGNLPVGYAISDASDNDKHVIVSTKECITSLDGELFYNRLDGFLDFIHNYLNSIKVKPSTINDLILIFASDRRARLYINEAVIEMQTKVNKNVNSGDPIFRDDIADIISLSIKNVEIKNNESFALILSAGFRRLFCFDYSQNLPNGQARICSPFEMICDGYNKIMFPHLFDPNDLAWAWIYKDGWFPFSILPYDIRKEFLSRAARQATLLPVINKAIQAFESKIIDQIIAWKKSGKFADHEDFIDSAFECYLEKKYLGAISILTPRIEGILRRTIVAKGERPTSQNMQSHITDVMPEKSLLLPARFKEYLAQFYFKSFDEKTGNIVFSRNTLAHGVAAGTDFNQEKAIILFLIVSQLWHIV